LVIGLLASGLAASAWYGYVRSLRAQAVASSLENVRSILGTSLERDNDLLATVNAEVAAVPDLTNKTLAAMLARLDISQRYPGTVGFTYVERVSAARLPEFERQADHDLPLGATLPTGRVAPSYRGSPVYCLTRYVANEILPSDGFLQQVVTSWLAPYFSSRFNDCALRFQVVLDASGRTGRYAVMTMVSVLNEVPGDVPEMPRQLVRFMDSLPFVEVVSPVYDRSTTPATVAGREKALVGWALGFFDASEILTPVLADQKDVSLVLAYGQPGSRPTVLAQAGRPLRGASTATLTFPADPGWSVTVKVGAQGTGPSPAMQGATVLAGSLALTVLLVVLLNLLITSRRSALRLVDEKTAELRHLALHDTLTGLPNRAMVDQRAHQLLARARNEGLPIAVFFIDLDDFKRVNDTLGHPAGDEVLKAVAVRLAAVVRGSGTVGRLGGDEFVVLAEGSVLDAGLNVLAGRFLAALRPPYSIGGSLPTSVVLSASVGIAAGLRDGPSDLLRDADIALYKAKAMGKNGYAVFEPEMNEEVRQQLALETEVAEAFAKDEFFVVYQPIVDLVTWVPTDFEALLRWRHPTRGVLAPAQFLSVLESSELIVEVGRFVLAEACRQAKAWQDRGHPVGVCVNVDSRQLDYEVLAGQVRQALAGADLEPGWLTLEVTEPMLMMDPKATARRLGELSAMGVRVAIDDFGTGYSSLSYLREFPAEVLKIDQSFLAQLATPGGRKFLDALVHLGRSLGLVTVAEGVEDQAQLDYLIEQGCQRGQGSLFSEALPLELLEVAFLDRCDPVTRHNLLAGR
jgi:diguanylate cyclase (GGDEF)-like protein